MSYEIRSNGDTSVIRLDGRFVFTSHTVFREAYERVLARSETRVIQLDMGQVEYLDSSALGMMLLLKDKSEAMGKNTQIRGARGVVRQVLEVANFHRIFDMAA